MDNNQDFLSLDIFTMFLLMTQLLYPEQNVQEILNDDLVKELQKKE